MLNTPFAPWPSFSSEEIAVVSNVLRSGRVNYWTGEIGREFERAFAETMGSAKAIALANGTLALDLALHGLGIGADDEVIVTPRTFIGSASCVVNAGARPIFADVDRDSGNVTAATVAPLITERTRAIIPVHLAGWPVDMPAMMALAREHGIAVIEDCAQAHGARIGDRSVGSFGTIGAWSFCQDKIMTTGGEGGMVTTNDEDLWSRMWSFKDHGKSYEAVYRRDHPPGFRWLHETIGTNWRLTEMQSALGLHQIGLLADWIEARTRNALAIADVAREFPAALRVPMPDTGVTHAFYRFYIYVRPDGLRTGWTRDRVVQEMTLRGAPVFQGSCAEIYREKAFVDLGVAPAQPRPVAWELGETSIAVLTHPTLTQDDLTRMGNALREVMTLASQ